VVVVDWVDRFGAWLTRCWLNETLRIGPRVGAAATWVTGR
jgi:hypothetical protein